MIISTRVLSVMNLRRGLYLLVPRPQSQIKTNTEDVHNRASCIQIAICHKLCPWGSVLIGCARFNCEVSGLKSETPQVRHTPALTLQFDRDMMMSLAATGGGGKRNREKAPQRREKMSDGEGEKWWLGIRVKETPVRREIWNWESSEKWKTGDHLPNETDTSHMSSSQVVKLDTHRIMNISHIQHLCFYSIIFQRLGVDDSKMIRLILFCWSCTESKTSCSGHQTHRDWKIILWSQLMASYMKYVSALSARHKISRKQTDKSSLSFCGAIVQKSADCRETVPPHMKELYCIQVSSRWKSHRSKVEE